MKGELKMIVGEVFNPNEGLHEDMSMRADKRPNDAGFKVDYDFVPLYKSEARKRKSDILSYAGFLLELVGARTLIVGVDEEDKPFVLECHDRLNNALDFDLESY